MGRSRSTVIHSSATTSSRGSTPADPPGLPSTLVSLQLRGVGVGSVSPVAQMLKSEPRHEDSATDSDRRDDSVVCGLVCGAGGYAEEQRRVFDGKGPRLERWRCVVARQLTRSHGHTRGATPCAPLPSTERSPSVSGSFVAADRMASTNADGPEQSNASGPSAP